MSDQHLEAAAPVEPNFDRTPQPVGDGPADPLVYDASPRALRQRTVNFAAKRLVDMRYVSRLDRATAEWHFGWRPAVAPGGLAFRAAPDGQLELAAAQRRGDILVEMDDADRCFTVRWSDAGFGEPVVGAFRRHRRQFDCVRCRLRDIARLCQARVLYLQNGMWEAAIAAAMVWFSAAKSIGQSVSLLTATVRQWRCMTRMRWLEAPDAQAASGGRSGNMRSLIARHAETINQQPVQHLVIR